MIFVSKPFFPLPHDEQRKLNLFATFAENKKEKKQEKPTPHIKSFSIKSVAEKKKHRPSLSCACGQSLIFPKRSIEIKIDHNCTFL
ncbi:Uncharacterized protein TCM_008333 [Theobroma cacao]|uniref:Uncharacterized protein n=1 Tax=Theobroma cacao TaxID=3641 RepID=A0A061E4S2_THECC|nr:Uncharacterized protein TCM_008333 [Theobroma cacao]